MRTITRSGVTLLERRSQREEIWAEDGNGDLMPNDCLKFVTDPFWSGTAEGDLQPLESEDDLTPSAISSPLWELVTP